MSNKRTTIAVSIETYNKLHRIKTLIEKTVRKKLDYDRVLSIILCTKALEEQLIDIQLEA